MEIRSFVRMNQVPDPDAIKMFVGQIPYGWNENDIRMYFEKFGSIYCIDIVRDKATKLSKGCCFLTYFSRKCAMEAQNACHNVIKLQGMNHPMQMRPADKESIHERRISVEMLSKKLNESDIRQMFGRFGLIEDCTLSRDQSGSSLGCAHITYSSKCSALNAIKEMHQSTTMEGCPFPLLVKMAEGKVDITSVSPSVLNAMADPIDPSSFGHSMRSQCCQQHHHHHHHHHHSRSHNQLQKNGTNNNFSRSTHNNFHPPGGNSAVAATTTKATAARVQAQSQTAGNTILNTMNVIPLPTTSCSATAASAAGHSNFSYNNTNSSSNNNNMMQNNKNKRPPPPPLPPGLHHQHHPQQHHQNVNSLVYPPNCNGGGRRPGRPNCFSHSNGGVRGSALPPPPPPPPPPPSSNLNAGPRQSGPMFSYSSSLSSTPCPGSCGGPRPPPMPHPNQHQNQNQHQNHHGNYNPCQNVMHNGPSHNSANNNNSCGPAGSMSIIHGNQKVPIGRHEGSTLFVYDLPPEYKEVELSQVFSRFGKVLSTKVFVDKDTNRSKCFGFVSFDNPMSAQGAIQQMNGLQMGSRRLQVRIKKPKEKM